MSQFFISDSPLETQKIAYDLARSFKGGAAIALWGELGAGKTTFVQGFGRALGIRRMVSPTYILVQYYPPHLYHIDLYRLTSTEEALALGLTELMADPKNILLIEWPEKIQHLLPPDHLRIEFESLNENQRKITITP